VRHIVVTHLDIDHAGGLADFPEALVHVLRAEHTAANKSPTRFEQGRYRPKQWAHGPKWQLVDMDGERFKGFDAVRPVVDTDVLMVPLLGHSRGHAAVAVHAGDRWLLHCGDAYFSRFEMDERPRSPAGMRFFQWLVAFDRATGLANQRRLRQLRRDHGDGVTVFSSHDPDEFDALAQPAR
jgi:glyoxylase-like metal-dependent hydrolase (beta-lactamase superfamily II)